MNRKINNSRQKIPSKQQKVCWHSFFSINILLPEEEIEQNNKKRRTITGLGNFIPQIFPEQRKSTRIYRIGVQ
jgi:hypothetical protein